MPDPFVPLKRWVVRAATIGMGVAAMTWSHGLALAISTDVVCDDFQDIVSRAEPEIRQGTGFGCFVDFGEGWIGIGDNRCARCPAAFALRGSECVKTERICFDEPVEMNVNRPGADYQSFDLLDSDAVPCIRACYSDDRCRAWTYVRPGYQGANARCWLKAAVPSAAPADCCISGTVAPAETSPATSSYFRVRLRSSYDITIVGGAGVVFVDIEQNNDGMCVGHRTLGFGGLGAGLSVKAGVSGPGDWTEFEVDVPARTADFKGILGGVVFYPGVSVVYGISGGLTLVFDRAGEKTTVWVSGGSHGIGGTIITTLGGYWF